MKSHLLPDSTWADIRNDDYEHLLIRRAEKVSKELKKRVIRQAIDEELVSEERDSEIDDSDEVGLV